MHTLETERLRLRPLTPGDLDFLVEMHADPEVARYIGDGLPRSPPATEAWLERMLDAYGEDTGHVAIELVSEGTLVGRAGVLRYLIEREGEPRRAWWAHDPSPPSPARSDVEAVLEVGYTLHRSHWGRGYATEAARAVRDDAFRRFEPPSVSSLIFPANAGSIRVAVKNGMRPVDEVQYGEHAIVRYRIDRSEWVPGN